MGTLLGARGKIAAASPARATWWGPCSLACGSRPRCMATGVWAGGLRRPRPLPAVLSALVTGESLERLRRGLAAGTSNLDTPTQSTDQLLPAGGGQGREVLDLEEANLDLFRGACGGCPSSDPGGQLKYHRIWHLCRLGTVVVWSFSREDFKEKPLGLTSSLGDPRT